MLKFQCVSPGCCLCPANIKAVLRNCGMVLEKGFHLGLGWSVLQKITSIFPSFDFPVAKIYLLGS